MKLSELLALSENLNEAKASALKGHIVERLESIIKLILSNQFREVSEFLEFSPAGDGMGEDNYYISFVDGWDISDACQKLEQLQELLDE